jgi:anti-sigma regulatory factor (Ser/Thr protein kinase)
MEAVRIFKADLGQMDGLCAFLSEALRGCGAPEKYFAVMEMAADEIFSNIAKYAYAYENSGDVVVALRVEAKRVELRFEDWGEPFDPLTADPPDLVSGADEREFGGLGIYLVRSMMDNVRYSRESGRNILTLVKRIEDI